MSETLRYLQSESADKGVEIGVLVKYLLIDAVKEDYLDYLRQLEPKLAAGAVVVADNTGVYRRDVKPYLDYVREPAGRYTSREYDFGDDAMEVSVLRS